MDTKPIHSLIKQPQENLEEKWKALLSYEADGYPPIQEYYHQDAIRLFETVEQMLKSYIALNRTILYPSLLRKVMPFFRRNYRDFIKQEVETIDIFPLYACNDIFKRFKIHTVSGESDLVGHYRDDEVALMKVNDRFYLF